MRKPFMHASVHGSKSKYLKGQRRNGQVSAQRDLMEGSFISQSYERDEDWLMTCPECNGQGTIGTGDNRKRCSKCNGAGRIKR